MGSRRARKQAYILTYNIVLATSCDHVTVYTHLYPFLQETKLQEAHVSDMIEQVGLHDWHVTFNCSTAKKGYSGTATLCRSVAQVNAMQWVASNQLTCNTVYMCCACMHAAHKQTCALSAAHHATWLATAADGQAIACALFSCFTLQAQAVECAVWHRRCGA